MINSKSRIQNFYILLSILLPVLSVYISPIKGVDLGTAVVLLFAVFMFMNRPSFHKLGLLGLYMFYSFLITIPVLLGYGDVFSSSVSIVFLRLMRFLVLITVMIGFGYNSYYDEKKYIKTYKVASILVAGYAILQSIVFKLMNIKLRNVFGPERGGSVFSSTLGEYESTYRPPSFFLEPSGVTYFLIPFICFILFSNRKMSTQDFIVAVVITIGILVSTSGQGLFALAMCWGLWGLSQIKYRNFAGILVSIICAAIFINSFDLSYTISRLTTADELNAVDARSGGYDLVRGLPGEKVLFGNGFANYVEDVFYSSFAEILFCTGVVGFLIILAFYFFLFIKGREYQRVLVLLSLFLMIGGGIFTATYLCLYLPLLIPRKRVNSPL